jgi:hypothetical protein
MKKTVRAWSIVVELGNMKTEHGTPRQSPTLIT